MGKQITHFCGVWGSGFMFRFLLCNGTSKDGWATIWLLLPYDSSRLWMLYGIGDNKNFTKFTGKKLCRSPFLVKLHGGSENKGFKASTNQIWGNGVFL